MIELVNLVLELPADVLRGHLVAGGDEVAVYAVRNVLNLKPGDRQSAGIAPRPGGLARVVRRQQVRGNAAIHTSPEKRCRPRAGS